MRKWGQEILYFLGCEKDFVKTFIVLNERIVNFGIQNSKCKNEESMQIDCFRKFFLYLVILFWDIFYNFLDVEGILVEILSSFQTRDC